LTTIAEVHELYRTRWGEPSRTASFCTRDLEIEVLKWDAASSPEGVALYATVGASARPLAGEDPRHRVELFLGLLPEQDDVASPLAALGLYPAVERVALDHGHTVPADEPLWPGTTMAAFLVVRPRPDFLSPQELASGLHVEFLHAIPIFESERAFKVEHGAEALLRRWEAERVPFWASDRADPLAR
jgi:hypothetical protein